MGHLLEECLVSNEENECSRYGAPFQLWLAVIFAYNTLRNDLLHGKREVIFRARPVPVNGNSKQVGFRSDLGDGEHTVCIRREAWVIVVSGRSGKISISKQIDMFIGHWLAGPAIENLDSKCLRLRWAGEDEA